MEEELEVILEAEEVLDVELETDTIEVVTSDYEKLQNLPSINDIKLTGNKIARELGLQEEMEEFTNEELKELLK